MKLLLIIALFCFGIFIGEFHHKSEAYVKDLHISLLNKVVTGKDSVIKAMDDRNERFKTFIQPFVPVGVTYEVKELK